MFIARIARAIGLGRRGRTSSAPGFTASQTDVAALLGRAPVPADEQLLADSVGNRSVLVTGAGGSIGSALCAHIINQRPRRIVVVERSEFALYTITTQIEQQLADELAAGYIQLVACLADAGDRPRMTSIMRQNQVEVVYHAAAFKHVPIVEHNEIEGIRNNAFATWRSACAAIDAGVSLFVLISTDKAVRPAGVMGATKRLAEMVLQSLQAHCDAKPSSPRFTMVRFGNVLGSSGSVVPLFNQQIQSGGPLTITHPETTRYFMSIDEAAELVIQAGSLALPVHGGEGGEIFVLDMGKPLRIDTIARRMIRAAGYGKNAIPIKHVGMRPGEKLHEELVLGDNLEPTLHSAISVSYTRAFDWSALEANLHRLEAATDQHDVRSARLILAEIVTDYSPQPTESFRSAGTPT